MIWILKLMSIKINWIGFVQKKVTNKHYQRLSLYTWLYPIHSTDGCFLIPHYLFLNFIIIIVWLVGWLCIYLVNQGFLKWFDVSAKANINIDKAARFLVERILGDISYQSI